MYILFVLFTHYIGFIMQITLLHKRNPLINYSPGAWKWSSESREYFNLWICLEGEGELLVNTHKVEVFPGVGLLLPPAAFV
jgi:mannose-6-phosphate isomerase-like protein (cupin superfamily)